MPRYKDSEREQLKGEARQSLVAAAIDEFAREGYAGANINRISQAAGYAQGTVYNYFSSKRALFEAAIADIAGRHTALVVGGAATAAGAAGRLERFFAAGLAFAQGFPGAVQVIAAALYGPDPELRALAYRAYGPLLDYMEQEIVRGGVLEGALRPVDGRLATAMLFSVYLSGCAASLEGERIRQNPRAVASLLLDGLRGTGGR